jgi:ABC-type spermidine/putrescine transport system permease subunit II
MVVLVVVGLPTTLATLGREFLGKVLMELLVIQQQTMSLVAVAVALVKLETQMAMDRAETVTALTHLGFLQPLLV